MKSIYSKIGHGPMIWIRKLKMSIPYLKSEAYSLQKHEEKTRSMGAETKPATPRPAPIVKPAVSRPAPVTKAISIAKPPEPAENVTKDGNNFLGNLEAVGTEFLGQQKRGPYIMPGTDGNFSRKEFTLQQNMDAVRLAFDGTGPGPGELVTENVSRKEFTLQQNMDAVRLAFDGTGPGPGELVTENVCREDASFEENFEAVLEAFPGLKARQRGI